MYVSIALIGVLVLLAHLFARIFERTKIPDVLFLILFGLCLQPVSASIMPANSGALGALLGALTLVAILFEGGLDLPLAVLRKTMREAFALAILNFLATMLLVGICGSLLSGVGLAGSFLLGAIVACTSPAVVIPLVRQIGMEQEGQTILSVESAISNALSFVVVFGLLDAYRFGQFRVVVMAGQIALALLVSSLLGFAGGLWWLGLFDRVRQLKNGFFTTFAFAFIIFGLVEAFRCNGYIAALAFGLTLGNGQVVGMSALGRRLGIGPVVISPTERRFFSEIVFLLKSFFFVYIGLAIRLSDPWTLYLGVLFTLVIFGLRIPVARLSVSKATCAPDASLIAVMSPKGIAVAALGTIVAEYGIPAGDQIKNLCFAIVLFSISATCILVFLLKNTRFCRVYLSFFLGFREPRRDGASGQ